MLENPPFCHETTEATFNLNSCLTHVVIAAILRWITFVSPRERSQQSVVTGVGVVGNDAAFQWQVLNERGQVCLFDCNRVWCSTRSRHSKKGELAVCVTHSLDVDSMTFVMSREVGILSGSNLTECRCSHLHEKSIQCTHTAFNDSVRADGLELRSSPVKFVSCLRKDDVEVRAVVDGMDASVHASVQGGSGNASSVSDVKPVASSKPSEC